MILAFKEQFVSPIMTGEKRHTIRTDKPNRWKSGVKIQFATGVRTKKYNHFTSGVCVSTQKIKFEWHPCNIGKANESWGVMIYIDGFNVTNDIEIIDQLVKYDGFKDRKEFFNYPDWHRINYVGKIIHWTNFRYNVK